MSFAPGFEILIQRLVARLYILILNSILSRLFHSGVEVSLTPLRKFVFGARVVFQKKARDRL
jgi:hypothetical protein